MRFPLAILLSLFCLAAQAQLVGSVGAAVPLGAFGGTEVGTDDGFARTGLAAFVDLAVPLGVEAAPGLAFASTLGALVFRPNRAPYTPISPDPEAEGTVEVGSWVVVPVLLGAQYRWPVSRHLALAPSLQAGVSVFTVPSATYEVTSPFSQSTVVTRPQPNVAPAWSASAGLGVLLFERLEIGARALVLSTPSIQYGAARLFPTEPAANIGERAERPIAAASVTVGYRF